MSARLLFFALLTMARSTYCLRRILVTGGNKGIGREIVRRLIADVPDVHVMLGSRSVARGEKAVEAVLQQEPSAEGRLEMVQIDVEDDDSVAAGPHLLACAASACAMSLLSSACCVLRESISNLASCSGAHHLRAPRY
jgi:NAD(P)-dependent dehydrogenase (short-subunit alcohol dehydrogenase family)